MTLAKHCIIFSIGGFLYSLIEILFRGYTHPSMYIVGGFCFVLIGSINEVFSWDTPLVLQMILSAIMVTTVEFVSGCIINLTLHLNVWDYSGLWGNVLGQIALPFIGAWFLLSAAAIFADDWIRYLLFDESRPQYKLF